MLLINKDNYILEKMFSNKRMMLTYPNMRVVNEKNEIIYDGESELEKIYETI